MEVEIVKEGLLIPHRILRNANISGNIDVKVRDGEVIIKEKNITRGLRGYCGKLRISPGEMKEIYLESILEKYEK